VSDLVSLTEHVQASPRLIEQAIAREASLGSQENDVIVLDDITPPFMKATAALNACDANLAIARQLPARFQGAGIRSQQFGLEPAGAFDHQRLSG
jgi:hypothetical protein